MSTKIIFRLLGTCMVLDGIISLIFGKAYVRAWLRRGRPSRIRFSPLLHWPGWLIRVTGAAEAVAGASMLTSVPLKVPELYRVFAPAYDPFRSIWDATLARDVEPAIDRAVSEYLPPAGSILDLGCGTGVNVGRLRRLGVPFSQYVGVDRTPEMLAVAKKKYGHLPNVSFRELDLLSDTLPDGEFDLVISTWVLSHLKEKAGKVVENARQRLKPGGHMVLLMYSRADSWIDLVGDALARVDDFDPVPMDIYLSFPGRVLLQRFAGGMATLVVLQRESG